MGVSRIGLEIASGALTLALNVMQSDLFRELKEAWLKAEQAVESIGRLIENTIREARDQLAIAEGYLVAFEAVVNGDFEKARRTAEETVHRAQQNFDDYCRLQRLEGEKLQIEMRQLQNGVSKTALLSAEQALEFAKNNNAAFMAAKAGLSAVKEVEGAVYKSLSEFVSAAAGLCNITNISLSGTFSASETEQKPFKMHIEATILKKDYKMDLDYTPGQTDGFLRSLAEAAVQKVGFA